MELKFPVEVIWVSACWGMVVDSTSSSASFGFFFFKSSPPPPQSGSYSRFMELEF